MDNEIFESTLNSIQEKLGEETTAKIADDLGMFKTAQNKALGEKADLEKQLEQSRKDSKDLQMANARLLQQIPMENAAPKISSQSEVKEEKEAFDPRSAFDQFGRIKK